MGLFTMQTLASIFLGLLAIVAMSASTGHYPRLIPDVSMALHTEHAARHESTNDGSGSLAKRDNTKYVFMHHMVGNTFPYTQADWVADIQDIQGKGVDALALNMGSDSWQITQVISAYDAAASISSSLKLFISFDFTALPGCPLPDVVAKVKQLASHPSQFKVDGRPMVSSFTGACLGEAGWKSLKDQTNAYLMPFIEGIEGKFGEWPSLDTWFCWGCAWPTGNSDKTTADDEFYMNQLGNRYSTTISPWFFTHYSYKNFILKPDNWLLLTRWEQIIAMRDKLTFVELVTWNDYGESHYMGPIKGAQPDGTTWATGFPHTAWYEICQYYIQAFKTGSYPAINQDAVYYWARPHPAAATASGDAIGKPQGWDWLSDTLWVAVFATAPCSVTLSVGSSTQTFQDVKAGVTRLKIPLAEGKISVKMEKNGQTTIDATDNGYTYASNPATYNYNVYVGVAKSGPTA